WLFGGSVETRLWLRDTRARFAPAVRARRRPGAHRPDNHRRQHRVSARDRSQRWNAAWSVPASRGISPRTRAEVPHRPDVTARSMRFGPDDLRRVLAQPLPGLAAQLRM